MIDFWRFEHLPTSTLKQGWVERCKVALVLLVWLKSFVATIQVSVVSQ